MFYDGAEHSGNEIGAYLAGDEDIMARGALIETARLGYIAQGIFGAKHNRRCVREKFPIQEFSP